MLLPVLLLLSFKCGPSAQPKTTAFNLVTEKQFNDLFPQRDKFYTYTAFIKAVKDMSLIKLKITQRDVYFFQFIRTDKSTGKSTQVRQDMYFNEDWAKEKPEVVYNIDFGNFCTESSPSVNKKELAAFFAQIAHETRLGQNGTYTDGLMLIHEGNGTLPYIADNKTYPAVAGKKYYGRGPMQLSYNSNYGKISDCLFGDKNVLLNNPGLIETDPVVAFKTAICFWMMPEINKPAAHDVMTGKWQPTADDKAKGRTTAGFGLTIDIINGALECNKGENNPGMADRIGFYQYFLTKLGASDPNCACSCAKMQPYVQ